MPGAARLLFDPRLFPAAIGIPARRKTRPDAKAAAPGFIGVGDRLGGVDDDASGRKVRTFDMCEKFVKFRLRIFDQQQRRVDHFGDIVRRNVRRHPDRDPACAVGEQVRKEAGHDLGLFVFAVISRLEIDRAFVEPLHQVDRDPRQPRFGVAIGRGVIAVDIAEIALSVDQRIA